MSTSPTFGVSADFTPAPVEDADAAWLLRALFSEPAPEAATPPPCGIEAAFDRVDRHLAWFEADTRTRGVVA